MKETITKKIKIMIEETEKKKNRFSDIPALKHELNVRIDTLYDVLKEISQ